MSDTPKNASLDDVARSITDMQASMLGIQGSITEMRGSMSDMQASIAEMRGSMGDTRTTMNGMQGSMSDMRAVMATKQDIRRLESTQYETNRRLGGVEVRLEKVDGHVEALDNDVKELYLMVA